ncbi:MAG: hypothetical protein M3P08_04730 [Thermoproteota archaeon]|jgi:hypothetical protein|nr:hypothetical protein [Thermoproteota archaeon]
MSFAELIYPSPEDTNLHVTTAMDSNEKTEASPIARISKKIDFILCNSCFWCASYLNLSSFGVIECPSCKENTIERMPLSANDVYLFDYNRVTGVILEFSNYNKGTIVSYK